MAQTGKYDFNFDERTVLVVEDNMISYKLIEAMLSRVNFKLIHAGNGKKAIECCKNHPEIDIVLMDLQLPVLGGIEATRAIAKLRPELPVIATTANAFSEDREACLEAGCKAYMSKPIAFDRLFNLIQSIFSQDGA